ncbi:MAG: Lar family restriction alleviation protein [Prevotellaceae bacterium]|jgi:hypothetical protein|nr:Lar family restriction alleviation protein [Prevotellaceae bacterium]
MAKLLKPCPLCGEIVNLHIISAINGNDKKAYRVVCCKDQCKHKLPSDWYEKQKDAVDAWNSLKSNEIASLNRDYERISNDLLQKSVDEIIDAITGCNKFDQIFLQNKIKEIVIRICQNCRYNL